MWTTQGPNEFKADIREEIANETLAQYNTIQPQL